jgi:hypothetical protein
MRQTYHYVYCDVSFGKIPWWSFNPLFLLLYLGDAANSGFFV